MESISFANNTTSAQKQSSINSGVSNDQIFLNTSEVPIKDFCML